MHQTIDKVRLDPIPAQSLKSNRFKTVMRSRDDFDYNDDNNNDID